MVFINDHRLMDALNDLLKLQDVDMHKPSKYRVVEGETIPFAQIIEWITEAIRSQKL
jgi:hypothetical protein